MPKGAKFNTPPSFAARNPNAGRGTAPQAAKPYKPAKAGPSTKGQGAVPKASSAAQPLVSGGKGKAMAGRALRGSPKAF